MSVDREHRSVGDLVATITLPPDAQAPGRARDFIAHQAHSLPADVVDDAQLLVSEVVGNAVRHGDGEVTLRLRVHPPALAVTVTDVGREMPVVADRTPDPSRTHGRGLLIVEAVASRWGVSP